jgi:hypothetical protein
MTNSYIPGRYHGPLNVDLSAHERKVIYRRRRVDLATKHASQSARKYATVLRNRSLMVDGRVTPMDIAGSLVGIEQTMARYAVHTPLRAFAAREVQRLLTEVHE